MNLRNRAENKGIIGLFLSTKKLCALLLQPDRGCDLAVVFKVNKRCGITINLISSFFFHVYVSARHFTWLQVVQHYIIRQWKRTLACVYEQKNVPWEATLLDTSTRPYDFIESCHVCFHQKLTFYTRHTRRH